MPRPIKNYCDYFAHDRDMRNHRKIKAIRTKFGIIGYAVWVMILEYLTGADGNVFEYSDVEFELMAGDYGVSATEIRSVVDYCSSLELLFIKDGFVHSESLDERLGPVYEKRGRSKDKSRKQHRTDGKFSSRNTDNHGVSATEKPQKKVKESKVKESILINTALSEKNNVVGVVREQSKSGVKKIKSSHDIKDPFEGKLLKWVDWKIYKKKEHRFSYKSSESENQALKNLHELCNGDISIAEKIIEQSIGNAWQGLFKLKNSNNGQPTQQRSTKSSGAEKLIADLKKDIDAGRK